MAKRGIFETSGKRYEAALDADGNDIETRIGIGPLSFTPQSATTGNLDLLVQPGIVFDEVFFILRKNFTGGAVSAATISAGTTASPTIYVLATSVFTGASAPIGVSNAQKGSAYTSPSTPFANPASPWASGTLRVQLVTTTANISALTQGWLELFVRGHLVSVRS
jgi:hypothetical protein